MGFPDSSSFSVPKNKCPPFSSLPVETNVFTCKSNIWLIYSRHSGIIKKTGSSDKGCHSIPVITSEAKQYRPGAGYCYGGTMITKERVEEVLGKIRSGLKSEGGDIELIEVKDDIVYVKLTGACGTCPMSSLTLKNWVESTMRNEIPEVKAVQAI